MAPLVGTSLALLCPPYVAAVKAEMKQWTPASYIGNAVAQAKKI